MPLLRGCKVQSWSSIAEQKLGNLGVLSHKLQKKDLLKTLLLVPEIQRIVSPTWLTGVDTGWTGTDTGCTMADGALEVSWCLLAVLTAGDAAFREVSAGFGLLWNVNKNKVSIGKPELRVCPLVMSVPVTCQPQPHFWDWIPIDLNWYVLLGKLHFIRIRLRILPL